MDVNLSLELGMVEARIGYQSPTPDCFAKSGASGVCMRFFSLFAVMIDIDKKTHRLRIIQGRALRNNV